MSEDGPETDHDAASERFGAVDPGALREIRDVFVEMEPLVESTSLDDPLSPSELRVTLAEGIGDAAGARFDVQWSVRNYYSFHYTDDAGVDARFDRHPKPEGSTSHFHVPPDADSDAIERSCITVTEPRLVARAVLKCWRRAHDRGTVDGLNDAASPP